MDSAWFDTVGEICSGASSKIEQGFTVKRRHGVIPNILVLILYISELKSSFVDFSGPG